MKAFQILILILAMIPRQVIAGESEFGKQTKELVETTIGRWLNVLAEKENFSKHKKIFGDKAELILVDTDEGDDLKAVIVSRREVLEGGKYYLIEIEMNSPDKKEEIVKVKIKLDWKRTEKEKVVETARVQQIIDLEYSSKYKSYIIKKIEEEYQVPDDSLATKLKC